MPLHVLLGPKRQLADMLNLSERRITELVKAGILPPRRPTGFDLAASVRGYILFLKSEPGSLKTERTRVTKLKGNLLTLELQRKTGELIPRAAVERDTFRWTRQIRDNFLNLPSRCDALVAAESDRQRCFNILNTEVLQILTGLADGL